MVLGKYSIGIGDRFAHQGKAQLQALIEAQRLGVSVTPVWNKSFREHAIIGTTPESVRAEADEAVRQLGWTGAYYVDADHITGDTVGAFLPSSDYFTLDVADFIGRPAPQDALDAFVAQYASYAGRLDLPGIEAPLEIRRERVADIAAQYLLAVKEAAQLYRHIEAEKGEDNFIIEISMDETERPQTPEELFFILAAIAEEGIPVQAIAPKFSGRFNKGVDYVGDVAQFAQEFEADLAVIQRAVALFDLPPNLKLSVHSGSDKFSIYPAIREAIRKFDAGVHLKTAGTTWLEEVIGLASAGGEGLQIARAIYREAFRRYEELVAPYAAVIAIDRERLPAPEEVATWSAERYAAALRHDPTCPAYNPHFRQLLHVGYKVAAEMGDRYLDALRTFEPVIARGVTENLLERHLKPLFLA